jgi:hypothetical protein
MIVIGTVVVFLGGKATTTGAPTTTPDPTPDPAISAVLYFDYQTGRYSENRLNPDSLEQHFTPEQAKEIL